MLPGSSSRSPLLVAAVVCALSVACGPKTPPPPGPPEPAGFEAFSIADGETHDVTLSLAGDGETILDLDGTLTGASWGTANAESVTLELIVDHKIRRHVIWTDTPAGTHKVALGTLAAGDHAFQISRPVAQTRAHQATLEVTKAELSLAADQTLQRYAPVILGRDDSAYTDIPLILYGHVQGDGSLEYTVVFSNEDGGTGINPRVEVAEWGRLSDIEWALTVQRDATGAVTGRIFQGILHGTYPFTGPMEGDHAILRVATNNGNFADDGNPSPFRLGLPVTVYDDSKDDPREHVADDAPGVIALVDAEGIREGKIDPACADTGKVWLTRCYAYVDVAVGASTNISDRRVWGLEAHTLSGVVSRSEVDLGVPGRLDRTGQVRVAIPVGVDQTITELRAYAVDDGKGAFQVSMSKPRLRQWTGTAWNVQPAGEKTATVGSSTPDATLWP